MNSSFLFRVLFLLAAACFGAAVVRAEDPTAAVKARIAQRLATVDAMKDKGLAGENNLGFLEARAAGADASVISAENADRRAVYAALAAQTKADPVLVGKKRAQTIAANSKGGVWIQDASGAWHQKS